MLSSGTEQRSISSFRLDVSLESCGEDEIAFFIRVLCLILTHTRDCLIISDRRRIHKNSSLTVEHGVIGRCSMYQKQEGVSYSHV